ncbi:MAG: hypothetical protein V1897_18705 [Pseudomonadota bacterium]
MDNSTRKWNQKNAIRLVGTTLTEASFLPNLMVCPIGGILKTHETLSLEKFNQFKDIAYLLIALRFFYTPIRMGQFWLATASIPFN